jgi:hypothetical protein
VERYLNKYLSSGDIVLRYENLELSEEKFGTYDAQSLVLKIGPHEVLLKPIGAIVIGARGRVDLIGPKGSVKIVLVPKEVSKIEVRITPLPKDGHIPAKVQPQPETEWRWKIATSPPGVTFVELNQESLMDAIMEVANA